MAWRFLPLLLVGAAAAADARAAHEAAFYLLVAAVPATAVAALSALGDLVDRPWVTRLRAEALLGALGVVCVVVAAAARAQSADPASVPALGISALAACLLLVSAQFAVALLAPSASSRL